MREILGLELSELSEVIADETYRALQVFEWIYSKRVETFAAMTNLPRELRDRLSREFSITLPVPVGMAVPRQHDQIRVAGRNRNDRSGSHAGGETRYSLSFQSGRMFLRMQVLCHRADESSPQFDGR